MSFLNEVNRFNWKQMRTSGNQFLYRDVMHHLSRYQVSYYCINLLCHKTKTFLFFFLCFVIFITQGKIQVICSGLSWTCFLFIPDQRYGNSISKWLLLSFSKYSQCGTIIYAVMKIRAFSGAGAEQVHQLFCVQVWLCRPGSKESGCGRTIRICSSQSQNRCKRMGR